MGLTSHDYLGDLDPKREERFYHDGQQGVQHKVKEGVEPPLLPAKVAPSLRGTGPAIEGDPIMREKLRYFYV